MHTNSHGLSAKLVLQLQLFVKINKQSNHNTAAVEEGWDVLNHVHVGLQSITDEMCSGY